jgi:hypothetical protein
VLVQLKAGNVTSPVRRCLRTTTARIAEREKFVAVLNANFEAQQAAISLMRAAGELESWIAATIRALPSTPSKP